MQSQSLCHTEGSNSGPGYPNYINESTIMKKINRGEREANFEEGERASLDKRPCPDFADIVSIVSQQELAASQQLRYKTPGGMHPSGQSSSQMQGSLSRDQLRLSTGRQIQEYHHLADRGGPSLGLSQTQVVSGVAQTAKRPSDHPRSDAAMSLNLTKATTPSSRGAAYKSSRVMNMCQGKSSKGGVQSIVGYANGQKTARDSKPTKQFIQKSECENNLRYATGLHKKADHLSSPPLTNPKSSRPSTTKNSAQPSNYQQVFSPSATNQQKQQQHCKLLSSNSRKTLDLSATLTESQKYFNQLNQPNSYKRSDPKRSPIQPKTTKASSGGTHSFKPVTQPAIINSYYHRYKESMTSKGQKRMPSGDASTSSITRRAAVPRETTPTSLRASEVSKGPASKYSTAARTGLTAKSNRSRQGIQSNDQAQLNSSRVQKPSGLKQPTLLKTRDTSSRSKLGQTSTLTMTMPSKSGPTVGKPQQPKSKSTGKPLTQTSQPHLKSLTPGQSSSSNLHLHQMNTSAYVQLKQQQQKLLQDHNSKRDQARKESIEKTLETINTIRNSTQHLMAMQPLNGRPSEMSGTIDSHHQQKSSQSPYYRSTQPHLPMNPAISQPVAKPSSQTSGGHIHSGTFQSSHGEVQNTQESQVHPYSIPGEHPSMGESLAQEKAHLTVGGGQGKVIDEHEKQFKIQKRLAEMEHLQKLQRIEEEYKEKMAKVLAAAPKNKPTVLSSAGGYSTYREPSQYTERSGDYRKATEERRQSHRGVAKKPEKTGLSSDTRHSHHTKKSSVLTSQKNITIQTGQMTARAQPSQVHKAPSKTPRLTKNASVHSGKFHFGLDRGSPKLKSSVLHQQKQSSRSHLGGPQALNMSRSNSRQKILTAKHNLNKTINTVGGGSSTLGFHSNALQKGQQAPTKKASFEKFKPSATPRGEPSQQLLTSARVAPKGLSSNPSSKNIGAIAETKPSHRGQVTARGASPFISAKAKMSQTLQQSRLELLKDCNEEPSNDKAGHQHPTDSRPSANQPAEVNNIFKILQEQNQVLSNTTSDMMTFAASNQQPLQNAIRPTSSTTAPGPRGEETRPATSPKHQPTRIVCELMDQEEVSTPENKEKTLHSKQVTEESKEQLALQTHLQIEDGKYKRDEVQNILINSKQSTNTKGQVSTQKSQVSMQKSTTNKKQFEDSYVANRWRERESHPEPQPFNLESQPNGVRQDHATQIRAKTSASKKSGASGKKINKENQHQPKIGTTAAPPQPLGGLGGINENDQPLRPPALIVQAQPLQPEPQRQQEIEPTVLSRPRPLTLAPEPPATQPSDAAPQTPRPEDVLRANIKKQNEPAAEAAQAKPEEQKQQDPNDTMIFSDKNSLDDYIIGKQIGQGAYAVVRIGLHKPTNQKVAMKIYKKYKLEEPNRRKSVKREIKLMEKMKHQHIIQLFEIIDTNKYVILIMEYVGGGSLHGYLKAQPKRRVEEWDAKRIFRQIVEGIRYCHSRCITHRDIKLENLLLDDKNNMKIIDFGFSTCIPNDRKIKIFCGTPSYMAPEIVLKTEYCGPPADIWALGVLLFTILSGQFPYRGATDEELYDKICRADYHLPSSVKDSLSSEAIDLLARLFSISADERPTAKEILMHPWLYQSKEKSSKDDSLGSTAMGTSSLSQLHAQDYLLLQKRAKSQKAESGFAQKKYHTQNLKQEIVHITGAIAESLEQQKPMGAGKEIEVQNFSNLQISPHSQQATSPQPRTSGLNSTRNLDGEGKQTFSGNLNEPQVIRQLPQSQKAAESRKINFQTANFSYNPAGVFNPKIVRIIVEKLGYSSEEVIRQLETRDSFVTNLYNRLLEEEGPDSEAKNTLYKNVFAQSQTSLAALSNSQYLQSQGNLQQQTVLTTDPRSLQGNGGFQTLNSNVDSLQKSPHSNVNHQNLAIQPSFVPSVKSLGSGNGLSQVAPSTSLYQQQVLSPMSQNNTKAQVFNFQPAAPTSQPGQSNSMVNLNDATNFSSVRGSGGVMFNNYFSNTGSDTQTDLKQSAGFHPQIHQSQPCLQKGFEMKESKPSLHQYLQESPDFKQRTSSQQPEQQSEGSVDMHHLLYQKHINKLNLQQQQQNSATMSPQAAAHQQQYREMTKKSQQIISQRMQRI